MAHGRKGSPAPQEQADGWTTKQEVWHVRAQRMIRRKDGKPFRFPNRRKRNGSGKPHGK